MIDTIQETSPALAGSIPGAALPCLLAKSGPPADFLPREPETLADAGLTRDLVESLIFKFLLNYGSASGRRVADQVKLPFRLIYQLLQSLKSQLLVAYKGAAAMSDYEYELTAGGVERARRCNDQSTYCGAAPVSLSEYVAGIEQQSMKKQRPKLADLCQAFSDLMLPPAVISQVGQAVYSGKGLFLYGPPGNGKTSIAERVARSITSPLWIPRTISVSNELIRLYDSSNHEEIPLQSNGQLLEEQHVDRRWVRIRRPTIVIGGELTLAHLELTNSAMTGVNESPLQMKSNGGVLVIDDFGRQRASTAELLNRWIVPLEKGHDFLTLPSGRQIQIPFDQLMIFATNLQPKQLVDEAFLRRIPYKIEAIDPSERQFRDLFRRLAPKFEVEFRDDAVTHLVEGHFTSKGRSLRYCYVRDLLQQIKTLCDFHERRAEMSPETVDIAAINYFAGL